MCKGNSLLGVFPWNSLGFLNLFQIHMRNSDVAPILHPNQSLWGGIAVALL